MSKVSTDTLNRQDNKRQILSNAFDGSEGRYGRLLEDLHKACGHKIEPRDLYSYDKLPTNEMLSCNGARCFLSFAKFHPIELDLQSYSISDVTSTLVLFANWDTYYDLRHEWSNAEK